MPLTHQQKESLAKLYTELSAARNVVAGMRSSVFLKSSEVDTATLQIVRLQDKLEEVMRTGELPPQERLSIFATTHASGRANMFTLYKLQWRLRCAYYIRKNKGLHWSTAWHCARRVLSFEHSFAVRYGVRYHDPETASKNERLWKTCEHDHCVVTHCDTGLQRRRNSDAACGGSVR